MPNDDDDDEGEFGREFENGHWIWDETSAGLVFISDVTAETSVTAMAVTAKLTTKFDFKEIDLIEQMRFRKRYQRKIPYGSPDVITIQDVKDLAIYTAPISLLSPMLISYLHLPTTERFIRALILYCQYYLQTADEMEKRMNELETKIRTPICDEVEDIYRENLSDLRSMVSKEYCTMIMGEDDLQRFHHMGPLKKAHSLSNKDARLFETFLKMCIQIVWLALGRRSLNYLELEVNRVFKSEFFNSVEHTLKTDYLANLSHQERSVLLGHCARNERKLYKRSPLADEVFCPLRTDYRAMGLGVIKYDYLTPRLRYLLLAIAGPEEDLLAYNVTVGILGYPRASFDTTLAMLPTATVDDTSKKSKPSFSAQSHSQQSVKTSKTSQTRNSSSNKSTATVKKTDKALGKKWIYPDVVLPPKEEFEPPFPSTFPETSEAPREVSAAAHKQWQSRLNKMLHPSKSKRRSTVLF